MQKYEIYKKMHEDLKKSMRARFYYQAIFIEYAIAEDRCRSALIFARVKYMDNKGREISAKIHEMPIHNIILHLCN